MKTVMVDTRWEWETKPRLSKAIVERDGAIKWKSNGSYLHSDVMDTIERNGFTGFSRNATDAKRAIQVKKYAEGYKASNKAPSEEMLSEMRAVYGKGAVVINILTGGVITL